MIEQVCTCPKIGEVQIHWDTCPFQFKRSESFDKWWLEFYGSIDYYKSSDDAIDEYNLRMLFAWHGWKACAKALEKGLET